MSTMRSLCVVSWLVSCASVALAQEASGAAAKPSAGKPELPKCIMMGDETIDVSIKLQTDAGPVYFCCTECIESYKKDAAKYADKVKAQQAAMKKLPRVQVACPMEGEPIDKKVYVERDGQRVYFCCDKCKAAYEADPAKHDAKLEGSYSYQTKCPVMGKGIDAKSFVDLATGQRVYLCCQMCDKKLTATPEKYAANLEAQGVYLDVKRLQAAAAGEAKKEAPKGSEAKEEKKP